MATDSKLIELVARHHMIANRALVHSAGITRNQWRRLLANDIWIPIVPGQWRHAATPLTCEMKVQAGAAWLGTQAALYGATAIDWLGIEGIGAPTVEFLVPRSRRHVPPWLTLHTTSSWTKGDTVMHRGVRTSTATRAIIDMARSASAGTLETVIDSAVRMRRTSIPTLTRRMAELSGQGRHGIVLLRTLLLDAGGESHLERRMLRLLRDAGLPRPEPQVVHRRRDGRVMRVDFQYSAAWIVMEVSGRRGHASDRDRANDARRRNDLQADGWMVLDFTTAHVLDDPAYVVGTVRQQLGARHPSSEHSSLQP